MPVIGGVSFSVSGPLQRPGLLRQHHAAQQDELWRYSLELYRHN